METNRKPVEEEIKKELEAQLSEAMKPLKAQEKAFIKDYMITNRGDESYKKVYKVTDNNVASASASRMLSRVNIRQVITIYNKIVDIQLVDKIKGIKLKALNKVEQIIECDTNTKSDEIALRACNSALELDKVNTRSTVNVNLFGLARKLITDYEEATRK